MPASLSLDHQNNPVNPPILPLSSLVTLGDAGTSFAGQRPKFSRDRDLKNQLGRKQTV